MIKDVNVAERLTDRAARRGPRPGNPSHLQRAQRDATRTKILDAAQKLLAEKSFTDLSIDDVLSTAPLSRSTFYRHFKSKHEIVLALYDREFPGSLMRFERLRFLNDDEELAIKWLWEVVDGFRLTGKLASLFLELGFTDAEFHERFRRDRQKVIQHLAQFIPAFRATQGSLPSAQQRWVRADLLLIEINRVCVEIALLKELPHKDLYIRQVAKNILAFLRDV